MGTVATVLLILAALVVLAAVTYSAYKRSEKSEYDDDPDILRGREYISAEDVPAVAATAAPSQPVRGDGANKPFQGGDTKIPVAPGQKYATGGVISGRNGNPAREQRERYDGGVDDSVLFVSTLPYINEAGNTPLPEPDKNDTDQDGTPDVSDPDPITPEPEIKTFDVTPEPNYTTPEPSPSPSPASYDSPSSYSSPSSGSDSSSSYSSSDSGSSGGGGGE